MAHNYYAGTFGLLIEADCGRDISNAQDTEFLVRLPVSGEVKHWKATIGDDGRSLQYLTQADDLSEVGIYLLHAYMTLGSYTGPGYVGKLVVKSLFEE